MRGVPDHLPALPPGAPDADELWDDPTLERCVERELSWEPSVDAIGIRVSVRSGVVMLQGSVCSEDERMDIVETVRRVYGVKSIRDDLEIEPSARVAGIHSSFMSSSPSLGSRHRPA
jgi:hypothetical protein